MTQERNLAQWYAFLAWPSIGFVLFHSVFILKVFGELPGLHIVQFQAQVPSVVFPYCPVHQMPHGFLTLNHSHTSLLPVLSLLVSNLTARYRTSRFLSKVRVYGLENDSVLPLGAVWSWLLQEMVDLLYVGAHNIIEKSGLGRMSCLIASKVETKLGI